MTASPEHFIPFAEQLANLSGEVIRRYFRQPFSLQEKSDLSPVTIADMEAEKAMRALIHNSFPAHGIIGEEFGIHNDHAEYTWVLDPIDGTQSFLMGRPIFGTLIGLTQRGNPILGIIDQPVLGERWVGVKGFATNFNYNPIRVRPCAALSEAILCTTSPDLFAGDDARAFTRVRKNVRYTNYGGDCYSYGLLAKGMVDIVVESGLKPHDFSALVPVVKGAGGIITDWEGKPITLQSDGRVLVAGDERVHAQALKLLQGKKAA